MSGAECGHPDDAGDSGIRQSIGPGWSSRTGRKPGPLPLSRSRTATTPRTLSRVSRILAHHPPRALWEPGKLDLPIRLFVDPGQGQTSPSVSRE